MTSVTKLSTVMVKASVPPFLPPLLVVINITPLAPLAPYTAVAAASLSTSIFSISLGFKKLMELCDCPEAPFPCASVIGSIGIPSITYKGWVPPSIELVPRIEMPIPPPGSELSLITTPATCPCNICSIEVVLFFSSCFEVTWVIDPERSFLLMSK